jgi:N-acyl-D-aspartate/D-glutamate deacylase
VDTFDLVISNGRWFDGTGAPSALRDVGIKDGRVVAIEAELPAARERLDARGCWVLPGFVDIHTHYDAELLVAPALRESLRHGVTSVFVGSCSLSTIFSSPLDCADLFSRVEAVPRAHVLAALEQVKTWSSAADYARHLESLPLGPNVAAFVGHSDLRAHVMGLGRSVDERVRPTKDELARMERLLEESLAEGFLGLSTMSNPWDKLAGDRWRSRSLPSTFAPWSEYRRLARVLRRAGRVFQGVPDLVTKVDAVGFFLQSLGLPGGVLGRRALKTSLLTAADPKATPFVSRLITFAARLLNRLGADVRWQHLPVPFEVYADGIDLVVFEEFGAGQAALHLEDQVQRNALMQDEGYRRRFRKDYEKRFSPRVWHRDFHDALIVACPDASVVGRSFGDVADARGVHPVDAYLDLVVAHGTRLRWRTTIANHRPRELDRLAADPSVQLGFADSGAHLRNMAFYSAPVRFLRRVHDAQAAGRPFLTLERAVHRLTGELGDWFGIDAGRLQVGDRADVTVLDPRGLDASLDAYHEAEIPEFGGLSRMVNRSDAAVLATLVAGKTVWERGAFTPDTGVVRAGRFLRAGEARGSLSPVPPRALAHA